MEVARLIEVGFPFVSPLGLDCSTQAVAVLVVSSLRRSPTGKATSTALTAKSRVG